MANMVGTEEPIYGPSAIKSVAEDAKTTPYTELKKEDMKWEVIDTTCVETQSFYFMSDNGRLALAQVLYSNVAYVVPSKCSVSPSSLREPPGLIDHFQAASRPRTSSTRSSSVPTARSLICGAPRPLATPNLVRIS
jgi:hypothetical protein